MNPLIRIRFRSDLTMMASALLLSLFPGCSSSPDAWKQGQYSQDFRKEQILPVTDGYIWLNPKVAERLSSRSGTDWRKSGIQDVSSQLENLIGGEKDFLFTSEIRAHARWIPVKARSAEFFRFETSTSGGSEEHRNYFGDCSGYPPAAVRIDLVAKAKSRSQLPEAGYVFPVGSTIHPDPRRERKAQYDAYKKAYTSHYLQASPKPPKNLNRFFDVHTFRVDIPDGTSFFIGPRPNAEGPYPIYRFRKESDEAEEILLPARVKCAV